MSGPASATGLQLRYNFTRMLEQKAHRYGRTFGRVDRFFPSSQLCSECGALDGKKALNIREWTCQCGTVHDRDLNAARNILAAGRAERLNACGEPVSLSLRGEHGSVKQEPAGASHMLAGGTPALSGLGGRQLRDRVTPSDLGGSGLL